MHLQDAAAGAGDILSEAKTGVPAGGAGWRGWERRFRQLGPYTAMLFARTVAIVVADRLGKPRQSWPHDGVQIVADIALLR